jgi:PhnB protein
MSRVDPVPQGFRTVTPHLFVRNAADAIEFYREAFGAQEISRMPGARGRLIHAEILVGDSRIMLADEEAKNDASGPETLGGTPVTIHLYVPDADELFDKAVGAGAKVLLPLEDRFWGDRYGQIEDPFGHRWAIASRREDLTVEEILGRAPTVEG